ncbi:MAG: hypothetical protein PHO37_18695 [Kiritimatiellae bacterium]|nr:hypothetical protein [Kiritimatiellia bacterium]
MLRQFCAVTLRLRSFRPLFQGSFGLGHLTQGDAPCGRLPWAILERTFGAQNLQGSLRVGPLSQGDAPCGRLPWAILERTFGAQNLQGSFGLGHLTQGGAPPKALALGYDDSALAGRLPLCGMGYRGAPGSA